MDKRRRLARLGQFLILAIISAALVTLVHHGVSFSRVTPVEEGPVHQPLEPFAGDVTVVSKGQWAPVLNGSVGNLPSGINLGDFNQYAEWRGTLSGRLLQVDLYSHSAGAGSIVAVHYGSEETEVYTPSIQPMPAVFFGHYLILTLRAGAPYYQLLDLTSGVISTAEPTPNFVRDLLQKSPTRDVVVVR